MTRSSAIIDFISKLHGMDRLHRVGDAIQRPGAFDVLTGQCIEIADDFPEGEMLVIGPIGGQRVLVYTHILLNALILRSAQARVVSVGGIVSTEYETIKGHLDHKTGFSF